MDRIDRSEPSDRLEEACGVFGVYAPGEDAGRLTYFGVRARIRIADWGSTVASRKYGPWKDLEEIVPAGEDIFNVITESSLLGNDAVIILGDDRDLTPEEEEIVMARNPVVLSLGPKVLHTNQCITVIHNIIDRLEAKDENKPSGGETNRIE